MKLIIKEDTSVINKNIVMKSPIIDSINMNTDCFWVILNPNHVIFFLVIKSPIMVLIIMI